MIKNTNVQIKINDRAWMTSDFLCNLMLGNITLSSYIGSLSGFPHAWINWKNQGIVKLCFPENVMGVYGISHGYLFSEYVL